jgi:zinc protease
MQTTQRPKFLFIAILLILLAGAVCIAGGRQWVTQLDNGMNIIIIEDHSIPLAASVVNIRAGSHTETLSSNGLSHLLEHMLFNGTISRTGEQLKSEVPAMGGYFNAYTRKDYVAFEIVMPAESFIKGLEIQADQLLNSILPESELEREKKVVCEEIAQNVRNAAEAAGDAALELLFGPSGYGLPVIGNFATVNNTTRDQLSSFFQSRYVPNRMTAVIVGDVNPGDVLKTLRDLYEPVQPGLENPGSVPMPDFPEDGIRKILRKPVNGDAVAMILPAPSITDPSYVAFETATALWVNTPDGPFQQRMKPLAGSAYAYLSPHNGFSLLMVNIKPDANETDIEPRLLLENLEAALLKSIDDFMAAGATGQDVARHIQSARVDHEFSRERTNHLARDIGELAALGALDAYWYFNERVRMVSADQVNHVFAEWMSDIRPVAVLVQADDSAGSMEEPPAMGLPAVKILENGLTVVCQYDPYADLAAINLLMPNRLPEYAGIPRIVAELLNAGTRTMSRNDLNNALSERGIRTKLADWPWLPFDDYYDSIEYNYLQMECLPEDFDQAMNLFGQMVFDSVLPDEACDEILAQMRMMAGNAEKRASVLSGRLLRKMLFASDYHRQPRLPEMVNVASITPAMLRHYYQQAYTPSSAIVSVVGNVLPETVFQQAHNHLAAYEPKQVPAVPAVVINPPGRGFETVNDATASIRAALPLEITPDNLPVWSVVATLLSDQLQDEIRYRRGRAYRLGAGLNEMAGFTCLEIGIGTRGENLAEVETAAREIVDGISILTFDSDTVAAAVKNLQGREWRYRQRRINRAYFLAWRHWLDYGVAYERSWTDRIDGVTTDSVNQAIRSLKPSDQWFWAIAGREPAVSGTDEIPGETGAGYEH